MTKDNGGSSARECAFVAPKAIRERRYACRSRPIEADSSLCPSAAVKFCRGKSMSDGVGILGSWELIRTDRIGPRRYSSPGVETYAYVDNDPVSFFDPNGLGKEGGQKNIGGDGP